MSAPGSAAPADQAWSRRALLPDPLVLASWAFTALSVFFLALGLLVAIALPYGDYDALSLGTWSREIALHWPHFRFGDVIAGEYQRPVFYYAQGTLWAAFGF